MGVEGVELYLDAVEEWGRGRQADGCDNHASGQEPRS